MIKDLEVSQTIFRPVKLRNKTMKIPGAKAK
jgi:hypothetical protein